MDAEHPDDPLNEDEFLDDDQVIALAFALRSVEPSSRTDEHVAVALAAWDELDESSHGAASVVAVHRRRWTSRTSLLGAAAAIVLTVTGATVLIGLDGLGDRGPSEATPSAGAMLAMDDSSDSDDADDVGDADESDDADLGDLGRADTFALAEADAADDADAAWAGEPDDAYLGEVSDGRLADLVAELLPGRSPRPSDPCSDRYDAFVAYGAVDAREVVIGVDHAVAVALDVESCEMATSAPLETIGSP